MSKEAPDTYKFPPKGSGGVTLLMGSGCLLPEDGSEWGGSAPSVPDRPRPDSAGAGSALMVQQTWRSMIKTEKKHFHGNSSPSFKGNGLVEAMFMRDPEEQAGRSQGQDKPEWSRIRGRLKTDPCITIPSGANKAKDHVRLIRAWTGESVILVPR